MMISELRAIRDRVIASLPPVAGLPPGGTPKQTEDREMIVIGITVLTELLIDIKRIADAAEAGKP